MAVGDIVESSIPVGGGDLEEGYELGGGGVLDAAARSACVSKQASWDAGMFEARELSQHGIASEWWTISVGAQNTRPKTRWSVSRRERQTYRWEL